jgi:hypothetical protein
MNELAEGIFGSIVQKIGRERMNETRVDFRIEIRFNTLAKNVSIVMGSEYAVVDDDIDMMNKVYAHQMLIIDQVSHLMNSLLAEDREMDGYAPLEMSTLIGHEVWTATISEVA